jgi:hypothetical protein
MFLASFCETLGLAIPLAVLLCIFARSVCKFSGCYSASVIRVTEDSCFEFLCIYPSCGLSSVAGLNKRRIVSGLFCVVVLLISRLVASVGMPENMLIVPNSRTQFTSLASLIYHYER